MAYSYNFPDTVENNTVNSVDMVLNINGVPKDLTGALIECWFRAGGASGAIVKKIAVGSGITITNPSGGAFTINEFIANLKEGVYYYDIRFNFAGVIKTYVSGTIRIIPAATYG